jgi:hypothetical protein
LEYRRRVVTVLGEVDGHSRLVPRFAARVSQELYDELVRADRRSVPIAEICRQVGRRADRLGLARPSYEQVRQLVHQARRIRREPTTAAVLADVAFRARPPEAILDHLAGTGVPELKR